MEEDGQIGCSDRKIRETLVALFPGELGLISLTSAYTLQGSLADSNV